MRPHGTSCIDDLAQTAGPFITLPVVFTRHPVTGRRNVGMSRIQVYDAQTAGMHWHIHKGGASHFRSSPERMPVAVALGPDPITTYAATAPLPEDIDELMLSGFLRKKPVKVVKCVTCDLEVPAESQFILEGYVASDETRMKVLLETIQGFIHPQMSIRFFIYGDNTKERRYLSPRWWVGPRWKTLF